MKRSKKLIFTVTNDLSYDQRMNRICSSLSSAGYHVTLIGRKLPSSVALLPAPYTQLRIRCLFTKGFVFYAEFNIKLFFRLLFRQADLVCAIDLDTILPVYLVSVVRNIPRVYDAHELFCEMKEIVTRPKVHRFWKRIEKFAVSRFLHGYAVNHLIAAELGRLYGVNYTTIRNLPLNVRETASTGTHDHEKYVIYQGAVNEGRSFETLIPAMKMVNAPLVICGDGNFMEEAKRLTHTCQLNEKITFTGWLPPAELRQYTQHARVGVNVLESTGLNHRYSLANRFFDYIQSGLPQVCVDYPAYVEVNDKFHCALMIGDTSADTIALNINRLLNDDQLYGELRSNCLTARAVLNWSAEEPLLIAFYQNIIAKGG